MIPVGFGARPVRQAHIQGNVAAETEIDAFLSRIFSLEGEDLEEVTSSLLRLLPHFTVAQYDFFEAERLFRVWRAAPGLRRKKALALQLAEWGRLRLEVQRLEFADELSYEDRKDHFMSHMEVIVLRYNKPMGYLAKAQAIARELEDAASVQELYHQTSLLFSQLIENQLTPLLKAEFYWTLRSNNFEQGHAILERIERLKVFCSGKEGHRAIHTVYNQIFTLFREARGAESFIPHHARIKQNLASTPSERIPITRGYAEKLTNIRRCFDPPHAAVKDMQKKATDEFKLFLKELIKDAILLIGDPPCEYEVRLLGSAARGELLPFSDLEFVILIEQKASEKASLYFTLLVQILNLQIHSLGESSTLCFSEKDLHTHKSESPAGIRLDRSVGEVLYTHDSFAIALQSGDTILITSLLKSESLDNPVPSYKALIRPYVGDTNLLLQSLKNHNDNYRATRSSSNIKKNYIEPLYYLLGDLAFYWGIEEKNTLDIIEALGKRKLHPHTQFLLKEAVTMLYMLRLRLHTHYGEQNEEVYTPGALTSGYCLTQEEHKMLNMISTLILDPLYGSIAQVLASDKDTQISRFNELFTSCDLIKIALENGLDAQQEPSGMAQLKRLVVHIASLPLTNHAVYYKLLSKVDLPRDSLRCAYIDHVNPANVENLFSCPTPQGVRQSTLRGATELLTLLRSFTISEPTSVILVTSSQERLYLHPDHIRTLLDDSGVIRSSYPDSAHPVSSLTSAAGSLHFKYMPTQPLMEYAIHSLTSRIAGSLTPTTELVRFEVGKERKTYPVLISKTIPGQTLKTVIDPLDWSTFSLDARKQWTWLLLTNLLTKPGDGRPANYILCPDNKVFCVDNDISFVEPFVKTGIRSFQIHFCSCLYLILSNAFLDVEVLRTFSMLNAYAILDGWIEELLKKEESYMELFKEEELAEWYKNPENRFTPSLLLREGTLSALGLQFIHLQTFIADLLSKDEAVLKISPLTLLQGLIGLRSNTTALNTVGLKIHTEYAQAAQLPLKRRLEAAMGRDVGQSLKTFPSNMACLGAVPSLEEIKLKKKFALKTAREELLSLALHQYPQLLSLGELQGKKFIQGSFSSLDVERHPLVLKAYTHFTALSEKKPTTVILQGCDALRSDALAPFLHEDLEHLDISHSPHITSEDIETIQRRCPRLKELNISHCPKIEYVASGGNFGGTFGTELITWSHLKTLTVSHCSKLVSLKVKAPLEVLIAHDNLQLKTVELPLLPTRADLKGSPRAMLSLISSYRPRGPSVLSLLNACFGKQVDSFGVVEWNFFFGDVGVEPPLPPDIGDILSTPCPVWPGKKVYETHLLTLIPQTVNSKPLTLKLLGELIQKPLQGNATKHEYFSLGEYTDPPAPASHWALMTRDVLPGSRNKTYTDQQALVPRLYAVPPVLDATVAIALEYVRTGQRLYGDEPLTFTRCQEKYNNNWQFAVGGFAPAGLRVRRSFSWDLDRVGVGAWRKF